MLWKKRRKRARKMWIIRAKKRCRVFSRRLSSFFAQLADSGFYQFAGRFWDYECRKSSRKIDISRASDSSAATSEAILLQAYITVA